MTENKQLITPKIPVECYEFIKRAAKTTEFFNHNHVVEVALRDLQIKVEGLKKIAFGDYVSIPQKRYGVDNENYTHKVISVNKSNCWVDVPVESPPTETIHSDVVNIIECICCGVDETEVLKYKYEDVKAESH